MSVDKDSETVTVSVKERTKQITIFSDVGADPEICVYRERVKLKADGSVYAREDLPATDVKLSEIADHDFGGMTGAKMAGLLSQAADAIVAFVAAREAAKREVARAAAQQAAAAEK